VLVAGTDDQGPGAHRQVRVADRLVAHLQGDDRADERISAAVRVVPPRPLGELVLEDDLQRALRRTIDAGAGGKLLLIGKAGSGRATAAAAIAGELGHVAVKVDLAALAAEPAALAEPLALALREGLLRGGVTILDGEELPADLPRRTCQLIADACDAARGPLVLLWPSAPAWLSQGVGGLAELEVRPPSFARRVELWRRQLPAGTPADTLEVLASRYAFTPAAIALAARRALATARMRGEPTPTMDELADAARQQFGNRLGSVAQRIPTGFSWSDLVLPADTGAAVKEFITFARRRAFLLEEWGFAKKLPYGRGVSAILAGPPGTGKTLTAALLGQAAGRAVWQIDLSLVVSKYIGETEKNLSRVFDVAEQRGWLLFFDEADALFGKRSDTRDAHDRYANQEVAWLLQRIAVTTHQVARVGARAWCREVWWRTRGGWPGG
jgi:adenylate kinase family enzyme